jgi:hypothetical protein
MLGHADCERYSRGRRLNESLGSIFVGIADKYGLSQQALRDGFQAERG